MAIHDYLDREYGYLGSYEDHCDGLWREFAPKLKEKHMRLFLLWQLAMDHGYKLHVKYHHADKWLYVSDGDEFPEDNPWGAQRCYLGGDNRNIIMAGRMVRDMQRDHPKLLNALGYKWEDMRVFIDQRMHEVFELGLLRHYDSIILGLQTELYWSDSRFSVGKHQYLQPDYGEKESATIEYVIGNYQELRQWTSHVMLTAVSGIATVWREYTIYPVDFDCTYVAMTPTENISHYAADSGVLLVDQLNVVDFGEVAGLSSLFVLSERGWTGIDELRKGMDKLWSAQSSREQCITYTLGRREPLRYRYDRGQMVLDTSQEKVKVFIVGQENETRCPTFRRSVEECEFEDHEDGCINCAFVDPMWAEQRQEWLDEQAEKG